MIAIKNNSVCLFACLKAVSTTYEFGKTFYEPVPSNNLCFVILLFIDLRYECATCLCYGQIIAYILCHDPRGMATCIYIYLLLLYYCCTFNVCGIFSLILYIFVFLFICAYVTQSGMII